MHTFSVAQPTEVEGYRKGVPFVFEARTIPDTDISDNKVLLEKQAADSFIDLIEAAAKYGYFIDVNYGFRTNAQQKYWYRKFQRLCSKEEAYCSRAAQPGFSTHQEGLSVDISGCVKYFDVGEIGLEKAPSCEQISDDRVMCKTTLYWWLKREGVKYHFYNDVPNEPWHWTFRAPPEPEIGG